MKSRRKWLYSLSWMLLAGSSLPAFATEDKALIEQGKQMYDQNCSMCHQPDAIGKPGFAPSLTNPEFLSLASDQFLMGTIRDGRIGTGMPPFAHLGKPQVAGIVAFLRSHAKLPDRAAQVEDMPSAHGDLSSGKKLYADICSTCHGVSGDGYLSGGTGTAIGKEGFLGKVSDGFVRETVKKGRSNTRMRGFQGADGLANLSDREIDDVIVYLRSLSQKQGG